jgi:hypothetical protein
MMKRILRGAGAIALLAATGAPALGQVPFTPRALGMAGAYLGLARGQEALFLNPANLALPDGPRWSIGLLQFSAGSSLLGPGFGDVWDMTQADKETPERRQELLDLVPAQGTEIEYDVRAPLFVLQNGGFSFGVGYGATGQHSVGKDIADLLINGYEDGRTDYSVGNTAGSRLTYWDAAVGYGHRFGALSLGVTGHYIRGGSAQRSRMFEPKIDIENRDISVEYLSVIAHGGNGYTVDVGAALQPMKSLTVSAAVENAASKMKWSDDLLVRDLVLDREDFDDLDVLNLKQKYDATEQPMDPSAITPRIYDTAQGLYDGGYFPAVAKVGLDWHPLGRTHLDVGYEKQMTDGSLAGRWKQTASVGIQERLPIITVRAGYATDLDASNLLSAGLSLGPLELDVAKLDDGTWLGNPRNGWIGSFGLSVGTPRFGR